MSINPLFTTKKRDLSELYRANRVNASSSSTIQPSVRSSCNDQGTYPPSKRYCSRSITESNTMEDIFGDGEDFTADDLEEIDIIASQAYTQDLGAASIHANHVQDNAVLSNRQTSSFLLPQRPAPTKRGRVALNSLTDNETPAVGVLQSEHEDLKLQLKVLQNDTVVKNGEIKVLRDALRQTESNLEQQRIAHVALEKEKTQMHCEKEKELLKKIQSLQSELQFKDVEMIELKTKLQSCERKSMVSQVSPKKSPSVTVKLESCPSPQPGKMSFPTKESFRANTSLKPHVPVFSLHTHLSVKADIEAVNATVKQARVFSTSYCKHSMDRQGSVLLSTLMQQPEPLGPPGLYHLLHSNPGGVTVSSIQRAQVNNTAGTSHPSVMASSQSAALKDCQKLAISGLNSIALDEEGSEKGLQCQSGKGHLNKLCRLAGALRVLPLVEYHITAYYQALQSLEKSEISSPESQSISSTDSNTMTNAEDAISRFTELALASLQILYNLVFSSLVVVQTLLQKSTEAEQESATARNTDSVNDDQMLHPLFKTIVLLLSSTVVTYKREIIREQALCVLVKLAENSSTELLTRFRGLLSSPVLLQCFSPDSSLPLVLKAVRLVALLADDESLAGLLCSGSENCLLLALYTYVISRPDKQASDKHWLLLEHEVVRFLNKLITQGWSSPSTGFGATCLCNREVVKALVRTLHQEWLSVRRLSILQPSPNQNKSVQFLREAVMVLHSLYQKDRSFSEHCLEVFHQYDQVVPGVRALFRKFNTMNENEEFALDELCPPEVETEDEGMDCT
ncbi:ATR-interacting protein isoform 1-T2 [Anomaloglossus baeobatrachus]|uniref:ATR-interacting protein n=1 Tax=Anomaloglossus baeobatrachus TaxID=238106 RepID=UPI003F4FDEB4